MGVELVRPLQSSIRRVVRPLALPLVFAACAIAAWLLPWHQLSLGAQIALHGLVALGLLMLTGHAGSTSFGQAAFVGIGAYASAVATTQWGWAPWQGLLLGMACVWPTAIALGLVTMRLRGHFLPLATMAWGIAIFYLLANIPALGGFSGIGDIPALSIPWLDASQRTHPRWLFLISVGVLLLAMGLCANLLDSRSGRLIRSLRTRAAIIEAFGVDADRLRLKVFVLAALFASLAGWLVAHLQRFISPAAYSLNMGVEYLFMAVVGGAASVWGAPIGAALVTGMKEWLQVSLPGLIGRTGSFEMVVFGVMIIVLLQFAPSGLTGRLLSWTRLSGMRGRVNAADLHAARETAGSAPAREPARGDSMLVARGLRRSFGGLVAVDSVDLDLAPSSILGLIGPNGAGKSTVFNLLSGALPPDAGTIAIGGRPLEGRPARDFAKAGLARSYQHVQLIEDMSVLENVAIGASRAGHAGFVRSALRLDRDEERRIRARAGAMLERCGLKDQADRPAGSLPLGMQRIVEIARAMCAEPSVLLLDEPAAGLREPERVVLAQLLAELRGQGMAILLVEHDMDFVMRLCDRIVVLQFGRMIAQGTPAQVQQDPAVREAYLGQ